MKGWYVASRPDAQPGDSTAWYATFWSFCAAYMNARFGADWCLSPEQSVLLQAGDWTVPVQLLVRTPRGSNKPRKLPHGTSLLELRVALPAREHRQALEGLRVYSLPAALVFAGARIFSASPAEARAAIAMVRDASEILTILLAGGHSVIAGRIAGAFRNIGRGDIADEILASMAAAGYTVRESDPFEHSASLAISAREPSPYVTRVRLMWHTMRESVIAAFPAAPKSTIDRARYMKRVDEVYAADAYHSLSIEGYRVSAELIERVRSGAWNPDADAKDREHRDALAARGYFDAFQAVKDSVRKVLQGKNPGRTAEEGHATWYRQLIAPSVTAGILERSDLAGYRGDQVYIRKSMHVPPRREAVRELMPTLFDLLADESDPAVRVVLGHFVFVYIHPYMDGNGRMGRFLMNVMLAAGGYPWTVVPVQRRDDYMAALEVASVRQDITPFAEFLAKLVRDNIKGKPGPGVP
jgi:prophage maintenance system killer protein